MAMLPFSFPPEEEPLLPPLPAGFQHNGQRIVHGQRLLQASTDMLLGWTSIGERHFYVRQMKNMKGSIPVESLTGTPFLSYAWVVGLLLARAHALTEGRLLLIGCGGVSTGADVLAKLRAGAHLVQLYTAFAFEGPALLGRLKRELLAAMRLGGFATVTEAVGAGL